MILERDVIWACAERMLWEEKIGGICIPERSIGKGWFVRVRDFERSFYRDTCIESARFFRKVDVDAVGWFEEDLVFFEESLLPQKIEKERWYSCNFSVDVYIHHDEWDIRLVSWLSKKYYYGKSLDTYREKLTEIGIEETGKNQMSIVGRYVLFLSNPRFYTHPILALCVLGLKTLEFALGWLGYVYQFTKKLCER
jgi:hypothetical protein